MGAERTRAMAAQGTEAHGLLEGAPRTGIVVIGRNEGTRLERCLGSLREVTAPIVYVDSGSSDGSVGYARSVGIEVVELGFERPFTAARARNAGARRLESIVSDLALVQFIDGDCVLSPGWLSAGQGFLQANESFAAVAGRLRELHPEESIY